MSLRMQQSKATPHPTPLTESESAMTDGPTGQRTERPGETTASRLPAAPMSPPVSPAPPPPGSNPWAAQSTQPAQSTQAPAPERTLPPPPAPDEPSGPSFGERIGARWNRARDEHRESAAAKLEQPKRQPAAARRPARRARLRLTRIDPWSVMKTAFLLSIAFGVVTVVSVLMVWSVLGAAGVWDSINATVQNVLGEESSTTFDIENYLGTSRVLGFTLLVSVIDVVLLTAIATLAAFLYNMAAALLGGVEVTLAEEGR